MSDLHGSRCEVANAKRWNGNNQKSTCTANDFMWFPRWGNDASTATDRNHGRNGAFVAGVVHDFSTDWFLNGDLSPGDFTTRIY